MDLFVTEISGYGDLQMKGDDIAMAMGYESLPFLALFGDDGGWWGNALLPNEDEQFRSLTEKTLQEVALNSSGLILIELAIKKDLEFLKRNIPGTKVVVKVQLQSDDRLNITIVFDGYEWKFNWNANGYQNTLPVEVDGIFTNQFTIQFA